MGLRAQEHAHVHTHAQTQAEEHVHTRAATRTHAESLSSDNKAWLSGFLLILLALSTTPILLKHQFHKN